MATLTKHQKLLEGGPFDGERVYLSDEATSTITFGLGEQYGRYEAGGQRDRLAWHDYKRSFSLTNPPCKCGASPKVNASGGLYCTNPACTTGYVADVKEADHGKETRNSLRATTGSQQPHSDHRGVEESRGRGSDRERSRSHGPRSTAHLPSTVKRAERAEPPAGDVAGNDGRVPEEKPVDYGAVHGIYTYPANLFKAVIAATFPNYKRKKVFVSACAKVGFHGVNWSGGSKTEYRACTVEGKPIPSKYDMGGPPPWDNPFEGKEVDLPQGVLIVSGGYFCGKVAILHIHVNPADMPRMLEHKP